MFFILNVYFLMVIFMKKLSYLYLGILTSTLLTSSLSAMDEERMNPRTVVTVQKQDDLVSILLLNNTPLQVNLCNVKLSELDLFPLAEVPQVSVKLEDCQIDGDSFLKLTQIKSIIALETSSMALDHWHIQQIAQNMGQLERLSLSRALPKEADDAVNILAKSNLGNLKSLDVSWNSIKNKGVRALIDGNLKELTFLNLDQNILAESPDFCQVLEG